MMVTTGSTSFGSVLIRVLVNLVLLQGTRSHKLDNSMPVYVSRNGITTANFDLKLVSSIRELKPYTAKPKASRYRNVWEMDRSFRTWACKSALTYKDRRPKLAVYNPFEEGSANIVRVDGMYDTIAYTCPTVPAMYLEGRVDMDSNRAQITILKEDDHHRTSSSSPPLSPSYSYGSSSPPEERYYEGATFSSPSSTFRHSPPRTSYTSTSPFSSPTAYSGNRYSSSTSPSSLPWSPPPRHRDAAYKPASASRFRDTVSSKTSTPHHSHSHSRSNSNSNSAFRYSSIPSPPPAYAQPVKRSFGIGPFIMRLVT